MAGAYRCFQKNIMPVARADECISDSPASDCLADASLSDGDGCGAGRARVRRNIPLALRRAQVACNRPAIPSSKRRSGDTPAPERIQLGGGCCLMQ